MTDARYHHGDLRRALIEAARELLETKGEKGVSMRAAARIAGVSNAAPYRHFRDRDELMSALAALGHQEMFAQFAPAMEAAGSDGLQRLRAQGIGYVRYAQAQPAMFRVMHHAPWIASGASAEMDAVLAAADGTMEGEASGAQSEGSMAEQDVEAQVLACRALVYGLARMFVDGHAEQLGLDGTDELVERVIDVLGMGLAPRD